MTKILIAPTAFKHALTPLQACRAIAEGLRQAGQTDLVEMPIADGGNGTLEAFLVRGGTRHTLTVGDPLGRPVQADYGILPDGVTAVIEMAQASGLELLSASERDALRASTYGTGELLSAALEAGARRFILGMGGSATTDGGAGALQALGVRFLTASGHAEPIHGGGRLERITGLDLSGLDARWRDCEILIATDVDHPAYGMQGAAHIFAPQKGASPEQVALLDAGLAHYFGVWAEHGRDVAQLAGAGAAGALAGGLLAGLGGRIVSGVDYLLDYLGFAEHLADADWLITGEGMLDGQSLRGKAAVGVAQRAQSAGVPCMALVGGRGDDLPQAALEAAGIVAVFPIVPRLLPLSEALANAYANLRQTAYQVGRVLGV